MPTYAECQRCGRPITQATPYGPYCSNECDTADNTGSTRPDVIWPDNDKAALLAGFMPPGACEDWGE